MNTSDEHLPIELVSNSCDARVALEHLLWAHTVVQPRVPDTHGSGLRLHMPLRLTVAPRRRRRPGWGTTLETMMRS